MEISARVLREVEFNSSLRGSNTDEVDEFLEQVADAVDRLHEEAKSATERAETAERGSRDRSGLDDDESIRRTLVLAQRTADLAIREAQEEAAQLLDNARSEAETLVGDARDSASRLTSEAERRLREEVARLGAMRDDLKQEVDTLVSLLGAERERLTETLGAALKYVERSLSPSSELLSAVPASGRGGSEPASGEDKPEAGESDKPAAADRSTATGDEDVDLSSVIAAVDAPSRTSETPAVKLEDVQSDGDGQDDDRPDKGATDAKPAEVDDLEAAIAEDAAAAAPSYARQSEPEQYDWDSVIHGRPEPLFPDRGYVERPNLTALPSMEEPPKGRAAMKSRNRGTDWPA